MVKNMEQFLQIGLEVINILVNNGNEAYLTGEVLRAEAAKTEPRLIEVLTSASPDAVSGCLKQAKTEPINDYQVRLFYRGYEFLITSFRAPMKKNKDSNQTTLSVNYKDALTYCFFTIDTLLMRCDKQIIDTYNACKDIENKAIKVLGSPNRFKNDPLKILDGIIIASETNFSIKSRTLSGMKKASKALKHIPTQQLYEKVLYVLNGDHYKKGLKYLSKTKVNKRIPILGKELEKYEEHRKKLKKNQYTFDTFLACGLVKNKKFDEAVGDLSDNKQVLKEVVSLALAAPKSKYDIILLYSHGLDICLEANKVNYLLGKTSLKEKKITKAYNKLVIKKVCDLAFKGEDILAMTGYQVGDFVQRIVDDMVYKVLKKELPNTYEDLHQYAIVELSAINMLKDPLAKPIPGKEVEELSVEEKQEETVNIKEIPVEAYRGPVQSLIRETVRDLVREAAGAMPVYNPPRQIYVKDQAKEDELLNRPAYQYNYIEDSRNVIRDADATVVEMLPESTASKEELTPLESHVNSESTFENSKEETTFENVKEDVSFKNQETVVYNEDGEGVLIEPNLPPLPKTQAYHSPTRNPLKPVVRSRNSSVLPEDIERPLNEVEIAHTYTEKEQIARDYAEMKLSQIEREMWQYQKKEKEREEEYKRLQKEALKNELNQKVKDLTDKNMALIDAEIKNPEDKIRMRSNYEKMHRDLLLSSDSRYAILKGEDK